MDKFTVEWNKEYQVNDFNKYNKLSGYYGNQWGDPESNLKKFVKTYITPFVNTNSTILEIGPGGGRWTTYFMPAKKIICVDINDIFFKYLSKRFQNYSKLEFYLTSGYELNGILTESVDFVFSYGCFVHIEPKGINEYLKSIYRVLKNNALGMIQYADKTKPESRIEVFSNMTHLIMNEFIKTNNFKLLKSDIEMLPWASIVLFKKKFIKYL